MPERHECSLCRSASRTHGLAVGIATPANQRPHSICAHSCCRNVCNRNLLSGLAYILTSDFNLAVFPGRGLHHLVFLPSLAKQSNAIRLLVREMCKRCGLCSWFCSRPVERYQCRPTGAIRCPHPAHQVIDNPITIITQAERRTKFTSRILAKAGQDMERGKGHPTRQG